MNTSRIDERPNAIAREHNGGAMPRRRPKRVMLSACAVTVLSTVSLLGGTGLSAEAKGRSKSKMFTLASSRYELSVEGNFSLKLGAIVESGTITAPKMTMSRAKVDGKSVWLGKGTGRGSSILEGPNDCNLQGPVTYNMVVADPVQDLLEISAPSDGPGDAPSLVQLERLPPIPEGMIGLSVTGVVAAGAQSKKCTAVKDAPSIEVTLGGVAPGLALHKASVGLLLPANGGFKDIEVTTGDLTFRFRFVLTKR